MAAELLKKKREEIGLNGGLGDLRLIWPWEDPGITDFPGSKACTFALMFAPAIRFAYQFATREDGLLPMALGNMTYWLTVWATVVLLVAPAVTPALRILRSPALVDVRRMIG